MNTLGWMPNAQQALFWVAGAFLLLWYAMFGRSWFAGALRKRGRR